MVLATGLDQYLQEVFHHLDCRGAGRLPRADFRALCAVLGLNADGETATEDANSAEAASTNPAAGMIAGGDADVREEARLALRADPPELTFRQFHARLCGYFSSRAGPRLPRGALSEHIETQIRLRRPRRRRRPGSPSLHGGAYGERVAHCGFPRTGRPLEKPVGHPRSGGARAAASAGRAGRGGGARPAAAARTGGGAAAHRGGSAGGATQLAPSAGAGGAGAACPLLAAPGAATGGRA